MQNVIQQQLNFESYSPLNVEKLKGQNKRLYNWLSEGNHINCMSEMMYKLRIGYLNSRISDLKNRHLVPIKNKLIAIEIEGKKTHVKDYYL